MRTILGIGILVLGLVCIGTFGWHVPSERAESKVQAHADEIAKTTIHQVTAVVSGRDITLSGTADSKEELDALLSAFDTATGRRLVRSELAVLETVSPFTSQGAKSDDGNVIAGYVPTEANRSALQSASLIGAEDMTLASGGASHWQDTVISASMAMEPLESAEWYLTDNQIMFQGVALSPLEKSQAEAALARISSDVSKDVTIDLLDDGNPASFVLAYNAISGVRADGKLPYSSEANEFGKALGLETATGEAKAGLIDLGLKDRALDEVGFFRPWLAYFETASITWTKDDVKFSGELANGAPQSLIQARLADELGEGAVNLSATTGEIEDGLERVNAATGQSERFFGGFWLPTVSFDPSQETCVQNSDRALSASRVRFVTGSATLTVESYKIINELAAIIRPCVDGTDLTVLLGGHTDSQGDEDANLALSQERADAVRLALIARGVPDASIFAAGYGESLPIADNDTEEGRAANRRTTIEWRTRPEEPDAEPTSDVAVTADPEINDDQASQTDQ